ncbi:hypothetical protein D9758_014272 [Tetrapyrgos nigripes]|uniref:Ubiquitin carboxyl-terminal hydrolase n=1 Tax=Tetrapyrgos nigripes TaxID=182062 RepID=A0A8H5C4G3_9AGAR|nr:hypothetical protein D9758_014272 [Tetrapyrgos nigripes]
MSSSGTEEHDQCPHLTTEILESEVFLDKYKSVIAWNARRNFNGQSLPKRRKLAALTCGTCKIPLHRPFLCLHCSYAGCWDGREISEHLKSHDHIFCVDAKSGTIFCSLCEDMVHNPTVDALHLEAILRVEEQYTPFQMSNKSREPFRFWVPSEEERAALENMDTIPCQARRGLLNLGQTCFLNVVLQCFVHNPLLRNYFLGDKHNHKQCKNEDCSCCEMDKLFSAVRIQSPLYLRVPMTLLLTTLLHFQVYSSDTTPYGPSSFLSTTWRKSTSLAGYAQQDAHEFFISTLNQMHSNCKGSTNISCNCIIHSTFAGALQSDVTCGKCGNVTSTVDPMLDISLELKEGKDGGDTLAGCLKRFTQPEKLGSKDYACSKCGKSSNDISKRLSIAKLPPVLSFQFKRFEHKTTNNNKSDSAAQKLHAVVRFPSTLNMLPYTSLVISNSGGNGNGNGRNRNQAQIPAINFGPEIMYEYDLFAVINHEGEMNNGHYTNFARFGDEWYRFDDDKVTVSTLGACLKSPPYMCFYVKKHLEYKAHVTPTYVLIQKTEAVKEKERELQLEREREQERERAEREREREKEMEILKEAEAEAARAQEVDKEVEDELLATI